jgi:hypothetical protein
MTKKRRPVTRPKVATCKQPSETYRLSAEALTELRKIMRYNDSCGVPYYRVQRADAIRLLEQYGWSGSVHSFNRLIHANFGRSFTNCSVRRDTEAGAQ